VLRHLVLLLREHVVDARAAVDPVDPRAREEVVVAREAEEPVVALTAVDSVCAGGAAQRLALRRALDRDRGGSRHPHGSHDGYRDERQDQETPHGPYGTPPRPAVRPPSGRP